MVSLQFSWLSSAFDTSSYICYRSLIVAIDIVYVESGLYPVVLKNLKA